MEQIELIMMSASGLILLAILASKVSGRVGIPAMVLFLAVGLRGAVHESRTAR